MEEAEALVGLDGGAAGIGIATGLSAGAVTELGMTVFRGGAAGGVDVGTGGARAAGPLGGGSGPLLGLIAKIGSQSGVSGVGSGALQNSMMQPRSSQQSPATPTARDTGGTEGASPALTGFTGGGSLDGSQY